MRALILSLAVSITAILSGCSKDTPPSSDSNDAIVANPSEKAPAAKAPLSKVQYLKSQIAAMNKLADELNAVKSESDALRSKDKIVKSIVSIYGANAKDKAAYDQNELSETLMKSGMMTRYLDAQERLKHATKQFEKDYPDANRILVKEVFKRQQSER